MIPKIINYCWFGRKPLPQLAIECIASWKKYLPDYEIKEWNEDNFDISIIDYTKEAYEAKKYAFVSDYARFWILYKYGGVYFDTDVEIIKPMDDIIQKGSFMGCEYDSNETTRKRIAPGLGLGSVPKLKVYEDILSIYQNLHFIKDDKSYNYKDITIYTTDFFTNIGLKDNNEIQVVNDVIIYPKCYFNPLKDGVLTITDETYSIHHYAGTWLPLSSSLKKKVANILGCNVTSKIIQLKKKLRKW